MLNKERKQLAKKQQEVKKQEAKVIEQTNDLDDSLEMLKKATSQVK